MYVTAYHASRGHACAQTPHVNVCETLHCRSFASCPTRNTTTATGPRHATRLAVCLAAGNKSSGKKQSATGTSTGGGFGGFGATRAPTTEKKTCPCGSRKLFSQCCQPFHEGKALPPTAEALMRSRYSAYATKNVQYIVDTTHKGLNELYLKDEGVSLRKDAAATAEKLNWERLAVQNTEDVSETEAFVTFQVYFKVRKQQGSRAQGFHVQTFVEKSRFLREDGRWLYVDGKQDWEPNGWVGGL